MIFFSIKKYKNGTNKKCEQNQFLFFVDVFLVSQNYMWNVKWNMLLFALWVKKIYDSRKNDRNKLFIGCCSLIDTTFFTMYFDVMTCMIVSVFIVKKPHDSCCTRNHFKCTILYELSLLKMIKTFIYSYDNSLVFSELFTLRFDESWGWFWYFMELVGGVEEDQAWKFMSVSNVINDDFVHFILY